MAIGAASTGRRLGESPFLHGCWGNPYHAILTRSLRCSPRYEDIERGVLRPPVDLSLDDKRAVAIRIDELATEEAVWSRGDGELPRNPLGRLLKRRVDSPVQRAE